MIAFAPPCGRIVLSRLGERTVRIRKVEGSIPFESTKKKDTLKSVSFFLVTVSDFNARRKSIPPTPTFSPLARILVRRTSAVPPCGALFYRHQSCFDVQKKHLLSQVLFVLYFVNAADKEPRLLSCLFSTSSFRGRHMSSPHRRSSAYLFRLQFYHGILLKSPSFSLRILNLFLACFFLHPAVFFS